MWILIISLATFFIFFIFKNIKNRRMKFLQEEFSGIFHQEILDELQFLDQKFTKQYLLKVLYKYKFVKKDYEKIVFFYDLSNLINILIKLKRNIDKLSNLCDDLSIYLDKHKKGDVVSISVNSFFTKLLGVENLVNFENFDQFIKYQVNILYLVLLSQKNNNSAKEIVVNLNTVISNQTKHFESACLELDRVVNDLDINAFELFKKSS